MRVTTSTGTFDLDPAFKVYDRTPGVDLVAAIGYSRAAVLAAAGGTTGTDYVQNLNEVGIASQLTTYSNTLSTYLKANYPNAETSDIIGGRKIRPIQVGALPTSLSFSRIESATWTEIPAQYIHTVRLQFAGIDRTFEIPEIAGKKLSIVTNNQVSSDFGTIASNQSVEQVVYEYTSISTTNDCLAIAFRNNASGAFSIVGDNRPYVPLGKTHSVTVRFDSTGQTNGPKSAELYLFDSFCDIGPSLITWTKTVALTGGVNSPSGGTTSPSPQHELWLEDTKLEGVPVSSTGNITFNLFVDHKYSSANFGDQSSTYTLKGQSTYVLVSDFGGSQDSLLLKRRQEKLEQYRVDGQSDISREVMTETLNVMGQTWMRQTSVVDDLLQEVTGSHVTVHHRFGLMAQETGYYVDVKTQLISTIARNPLSDKTKAYFKASSYISSALEHGMLEQLQGASFPAVSTIKLIKIANSNGNKIFRVDTANFSTVQSQLSGYNTADINALQSETSNAQRPATLILPANGQIALQQWRGKGYVSYWESGTSFSMGMIIGGGYFGGFGGIPATIQPQPVYDSYVPKLNPVFEIPRVTSLDPVDLSTGAYLYENTDITLGGVEPRGLRFTRYYDSDRSNQESVMGRGWTHSYEIAVKVHSDVAMGVGLRQPRDASAMFVTALVATDLLSAGTNFLKEWVTAVLVAQWATDELFENAVSISKANQSLTYIKLPDGTYTAPPGVTSNIVKDASGLYALQDRFGGGITFNSNDKIATWTDADGNAIVFTYEGSGSSARIGTVSDNFGHSFTFSYNGSGNLFQVTDSTGRITGYSYDYNNDLTAFTDLDSIRWRYTYYEHKMEDIFDPLFVRIVGNIYDFLGRVSTQLVPRQSGTVTYDFYFSDFRNIEEDPDNGQTVYLFDKKGRKIAVQNALGNTTRTEYDGQNQVIKQTDPRGNESRFIYDGNNNLRFTINALAQQTENIYDPQYRLTDVVNPLTNTTQFEYDAEHHLTLTRDAVNNEFTATYYPNGQTLTNTDGRNTVTTFTYDTFGNPDTAKVATHPAIDYSYDAIGLMASLTDQESATTSFIYDDRGLVTEATDPLLRKTSFVYDAVGRLDTLTDRNLKLTDFGYTPSGKLDSLTYPDATSVQYGYDSHDLLISMSDPLGTTSNTYDAVGRLISSTDPNGFTVGYGHDVAGNLTSITYPGNKTVSYSYDTLNRLATVSDWLGGVTRYYYDATGRLRLQVNTNGTYTNYDYDDADRLISVVNRKSDSTVISSHSFTLDGNGNRTQETSEEPIPPSNLPTDNNTFTYNVKKNRLLSTASDTFSYDDEGQQSDKSGTGYSFDYAHRLTGIGANTQYYYDGAGNRLKATRNGQTTKSLYDAQGNLLAEADATNAITRYYSTEPDCWR